MRTTYRDNNADWEKNWTQNVYTMGTIIGGELLEG